MPYEREQSVSKSISNAIALLEDSESDSLTTAASTALLEAAGVLLDFAIETNRSIMDQETSCLEEQRKDEVRDIQTSTSKLGPLESVKVTVGSLGESPGQFRPSGTATKGI